MYSASSVTVTHVSSGIQMIWVSLWDQIQCVSPRCCHAYTSTRLFSWHGLIPPSRKGEESRLLCSVRPYSDAPVSVQQSKQLFVCYDGRKRGHALSKHWLSRWIVDVVAHAYDIIQCAIRFYKVLQGEWYSTTWHGTSAEFHCVRDSLWCFQYESSRA